MIVAVCGMVGIIVAATLGKMMDWRVIYGCGGVLGLVLLALRVSVNESGLFAALEEQTHVARGRFLMLFATRKRFIRYISCIALAVPVWFVVGVMVTFSPELGRSLDIQTPINVGTTLLILCSGLTAGGIASSLLSQYLQTRKKVIIFFIGSTLASGACLLSAAGISDTGFYSLMAILGISTGYWSVFLVTTAEQFGTNLRTTAVSTATNFVRASLILDTSLLALLKPELGFLNSVRIIGLLCIVLALLALWKLPESFAKDLDFVEE